MLKKNLLANVSMIVLSLSFGTISLTQSLAEEIEYTGTADDYNNKLLNDPEDATKKSLYSSSSASGNTITVTDPNNQEYEYKTPDNIYGGISATDNVTSNKVTIEKAEAFDATVYGGKTIGVNNVAEENVVTLTQRATVNNLYGGSSQLGANNNTVNVINAEVDGRVIGGHSENGSVSGNNVNLSSASANYVYGGYSETGTVSGNTITITELSASHDPDDYIENSEINGSIYGGYSKSGLVDGNKVLLRAELNADRLVGGRSNSGDATNNIVDIDSSGIFQGEEVRGGWSDEGNATGNEVRINGLENVYFEVYGGYGYASASNNKVTIDNVKNMQSQIYGGYNEWEENNPNNKASGNEVRISGADSVSSTIYGGYSYGEASNNKVTIDTVKNLDGAVYGGEGYYKVSGNRVEIVNSNFAYSVYGGEALSEGDAIGNIVSASGNSSFADEIVGGYAGEATALNNEVIIGGTTKTENIVYGGVSEEGNAIGNKVTFTDNAEAKGFIIGGKSSTGNANNNIVSISANNIIKADIYGGEADAGNATGNTVTLHGLPTVEGYDAARSADKLIEIDGAVYGGDDGNPNSPANTGSDPNHDLFTGNTLNLVQFRGKIYGVGNFENYNWTLPKDVVNNDVLVKISGKDPVNLLNTKHTFSMINDGNRLSVGDRVVLIDYVTNAPTLSNIEVKQGNFLVYDMKAEEVASTETGRNEFVLTAQKPKDNVPNPGNDGDDNGTGSGDDNNDHNGSGNGDNGGTETPGGGDHNGSGSGDDNNDHGGSGNGDNGGTETPGGGDNNGTGSGDDNNDHGGSGNGDNGGTETPGGGDHNGIGSGDNNNDHGGSGNGDNGGTETPGGGDHNGSGSGDNNNDHAGSDSNGGNNNSHDAPPPDHNGSGTGNNTDKDDNHHNASSNGDNNGDHHDTGSNDHADNNAGKDKEGDKNHVAGGDNASANDKDHAASEPTVPTQPVAPTEPNKELAGRINPQTKAFSEGRAAALGFVNQGADLIADAGIRAAMTSVAEGASNVGQMNLTPFMVMNGGSSRYKTGSHVDVDGFNMVVGLATGFDLLNQHPVTIGAFFEYGRGTYNTYNSFATYASVHGDGDTHYTGGGILGRIEFAGTGLGWVKKLNADQADGLYAEASFRAGRIDSDFDTNDILGGRGESSSYDSGANYYGLHGGVGYVLNFDERNSVDIYGRYLWTRIDSETVNVGRDRLRFDDADSSRIRVGARYTTVYNDQLKPYIGVAYEHEFDGEVAARAYGLKLNKPSLEGDTGIFEAGVTLKPISTIDALSVDVTGQGFVGQRQGGGGGLKIKYQF